MVLAAVTSLQVGAAFGVTLFDELGPGGAAFLRLLLAAAVLVAIWRPRLRGHPPADLRVAVAFGVTLGLMNWAIYEALDRIPLGVAVTIEFWGPLAVAVLGSRRPLDLLWVALAAAGILLLADPGGDAIDRTGVALALFAGGCWAAYILLSARTGRAFPGGTGLAIAMVVGAVVTLPAGLAQGGSALLEPELLAVALAVALASSVLPYSLELEALRTLPQGVFGVLMSLEPAVAALAGLVVLGQALGTTEWVAVGPRRGGQRGSGRAGRPPSGEHGPRDAVARVVAAPARHRGERGQQRVDDGRGREGRADLALEALHEQGEVQRLGHARGHHVPVVGELGGGDQEVLHRQGGQHLHAGAGLAVAAVGELVHPAGGDDDRVAGLGDDRAHPEAELHRALEDLEPLLLLGVHVGAGHAAVGGQRELELEQLAVRVGGGAEELDALPADGVLDDLSGVGHWSLLDVAGRARRGFDLVRPSLRRNGP